LSAGADDELMSMTSSMLDSEIQRLSSGGENDDEEDDDGLEVDGVFEMLDEAIGDSSSCNSSASVMMEVISTSCRSCFLISINIFPAINN